MIETPTRLYSCEEYSVLAPAASCLFCEHCTDVFYDYTHGPYAFICEADLDTEQGAAGACAGFREDGR